MLKPIQSLLRRAVVGVHAAKAIPRLDYVTAGPSDCPLRKISERLYVFFLLLFGIQNVEKRRHVFLVDWNFLGANLVTDFEALLQQLAEGERDDGNEDSDRRGNQSLPDFGLNRNCPLSSMVWPAGSVRSGTSSVFRTTSSSARRTQRTRGRARAHQADSREFARRFLPEIV